MKKNRYIQKYFVKKKYILYILIFCIVSLFSTIVYVLINISSNEVEPTPVKKDNKDKIFKDLKKVLKEETPKVYDKTPSLNILKPTKIPNRPPPPNMQSVEKTDSIKEQSSLEVDSLENVDTINRGLKHILDSSPIDDNIKIYGKKDLFRYSQNKLELLKYSSKKPIGVLIIDDVSFKKQVDALNNLNIPLTMAFLPSTHIHPHSTQLANRTKDAIIHLPLEANSYKKEETNTLRVTDSYSVILNRVKQLREDFPNIKYINNHTGSKFSSNYRSVKHLVTAMKKYNFILLDSKTSSKSKIKTVLKEFKDPYLVRDVFIDNEDNVEYIKKHLSLSIKKAKQKGYVVIIGHPKKETIQAISEYRSTLLKELDLITVNKMYEKILGGS